MVERVIDAGSSEERVRPLGIAYPPDIFSLSHVALPFPPWDALYGIAPGTTRTSASTSARWRRGAKSAS